MNQPSVKRLEAAFPGKGKEIKSLLEGGPTRSYASVRAWEAKCNSMPQRHERVMCALNEILGGYGVESLLPIDDCHPSYDYVNMGDTYNTTILLRNDGRFIVACWGEIVERNMNWYA